MSNTDTVEAKIYLILCSALACLVILLIRRLVKNRIKSYILCPAEFAVIFLLAYDCIDGPAQIWFLGFPVAGLYVALFGDMLGEIVRLIFPKRGSRVQAVAAILCSAAFLAYGMINMETVVADRHTYESEKLTQSVSFAFLSDAHIGTAQSFCALEKAVREIKNEPALDFVVLGGDITDEYTKRDEMEKAYALFGEIDVPVYFVYGNHDRQGSARFARGRQYSEEDLLTALEKNGITILADEYAKISDEMTVFGREDASRSDRMSANLITSPDSSDFFIVFDHQPGAHDDIMEIGADMQISGHMHDSQFFPLRLFYTIFGYETSGEYYFGDTLLYVSPGEAGWQIPIRTEGHCKYEIFTINPAA